jgi:hypothetical protein
MIVMPRNTKQTTNKATNTYYHNFFYNTLLLERLLEQRELDYREKLSNYKRKVKEMKIPEEKAQLMIEKFHRDFYDIESKALGDKLAFPDKLSDPKVPLKTKEALSFYDAMTPEGFVATRFFNEKTIKQLSSRYPSVARNLNNEINSLVEAHVRKNPSVSKFNAKKIVVSEMFNAKHPTLEKELNAKLSDKNAFSQYSALAAKALITPTKALLNPSGFLIGKAIGVIMKTEAMNPLKTKIATGINRLAEKTGLKTAIKNKLAKTNAVSVKRIATGVAVGCGVAMVTLGLMDYDNAIEIARDMGDNIISFAENAKMQTLNAMDGIGDVSLDNTGTNPLGTESTNSADMPVIETPSSNVDNSLSNSNTVAPLFNGTKELVIAKGDTLSELIEQELKESGVSYDYSTIQKYVDLTAEMNQIENPNMIKYGETIKLPDIVDQVDISSLDNSEHYAFESEIPIDIENEIALVHNNEHNNGMRVR